MGTFITWGSRDGHVSKWNATLNTYVDRFVIPGIHILSLFSIMVFSLTTSGARGAA
jgi:hypothetical protein